MLTLAGLALALLLRRAGVERRLLYLCLAAVGVQLVLIVLRGVASGRYLVPALPALGVLCAAGLTAPFPERARGALLRAAAAVLFAAAAAFLWGGLVLHQYLVIGA